MKRVCKKYKNPVCPLVSSQGQSAFLVLRLNQWSSAVKPWVLFLHHFKLEFLCSRLHRNFQSFHFGFRTRGAKHAVVEFVESNDSLVCACFWKDAQVTFLPVLEGYTGLIFHGRTGLLAPNPAVPRPAVPPVAPTQPAVVCLGFGFDRFCKVCEAFAEIQCFLSHALF